MLQAGAGVLYLENCNKKGPCRIACETTNFIIVDLGAIFAFLATFIYELRSLFLLSSDPL